jgi:hypothetical protein
MDNELQVRNVPEGAMLYDGICIDSNRQGKEAQITTWFSTMAAFAEEESHLLFKGRTVGNVGVYYTNQKLTDKNQNPFWAISPGVLFKGPGVRVLSEETSPGIRVGSISRTNLFLSEYWEMQMPRECAVQIKVGDDIYLEGPAINFPACYGPYYMGGASLHMPAPPIDQADEIAFANFAYVPGVPNLKDRRRFRIPFGIPKDETLEMRIIVSRDARNMLKSILSGGARFPKIPIPKEDEAQSIHTMIPARFAIEGSILGVRELQPRGMLRR